VLAGDPLGFLGGEPTSPQPGAEIPSIEADAELLPDQLGQARAGPQLSVESVLRGLLTQPAEDDLLLGGRDPGGTARDRAGAQPLFARLPEAGEPTPNGSGVDIQEFSDLLGGVSFEDAANGEEPSVFQFLR
jgi:hypothetical protein